jgi:hypothetical protein
MMIQGAAIMPGRLFALTAAVLLAVPTCSEPGNVSAGRERQEVIVTADDAGWTTVGTEGLRAGWVSFTLETVEGEADHSLQLVRFNDGGTVERLLEADDAEFLRIAAPIGGFVGVAGSERRTLTVRLEAGSYGMFDFGGTHQGGPNFLRGMTDSFDVASGDGTAGIPPDADGEIVMREFAIDLPPGFSGHGTYRVRNEGALLHELDIARLPLEADAMDEIERQVATGLSSLVETPGLAIIAPGSEAYLELDLAAGRYAFVCFAEVSPDGEPHALKGMYALTAVG